MDLWRYRKEGWKNFVLLVAGYGAVVAPLTELGRELSIAQGKYGRIFSHLQAQRMMYEKLRPDKICFLHGARANTTTKHRTEILTELVNDKPVTLDRE